ncbi:hypothetical protein ACTFIV_005854 [Dictyostelium citrinum]
MLIKICILIILINFINVCKSFYSVTTNEFNVTDLSDYYNGGPSDDYATGTPPNVYCQRTFYVLVEPLTTSILPKQMISGENYATGSSNSKVFRYFLNGNSVGITNYDIIIQDFNSINYTIPQFFKIDCVLPPSTIITSVPNNQLYKYPVKGLYYTFVKLENIEKQFKTSYMDYIYQRYSSGFSSNSFSEGVNKFFVAKFSIPYTSVLSNNDIIVNSTYSLSSSKFNDYILKPYFNSTTSLLNNIDTFSINKYPNDCTNLLYGQCVFLINLKTKSSNYFLACNGSGYGGPQLISGNELNGTYYLSIAPRFGASATNSIGSFENGVYIPTIASNFLLSYIPQVNPSIIGTNFTLQTQNGRTVQFGGQSNNSFAYYGDLFISNKKAGINRPNTKAPSCYPYLGGTKDKLLFSLSLPASPYSRSISAYSAISYTFINLVGTTFNLVTQLTPIISGSDTTPPVLENFEIFENPSNPHELIIIMTISDQGSGLRSIDISISFSSSQTYIYRGDPSDLIDGNIFNGVYQFSIPKYNTGGRIYATIVDNAINIYYFQTYSAYNGIKRIEPFPTPLLTLLDIGNVYFEKNDLDLSNNAVDNILYIQLKNTTIKNLSFSMVPLLNIEDKSPNTFVSTIDYFFDYKNYLSEWNETLQSYQIKFSLPARLPTGVFSYYIDPIENLNSATLFSMFGANSELRVTSNDCDIMGPIVSSFQFIPSSTVTIPSLPTQSTMVGFKFLIEDHLNGINSVYITITSNLDIIGHQFKFENISGNPLQYSVDATFPIHSYDKPQTYTITKFKTIDAQGYTAEYPNLVKVNPLFIIGITAISLSTVYEAGGTNIQDVSPPLLSSWNVSKTTVQDLDNILIFDFTIEDLESGVSTVNNPSVIIVCDNSLQIEGKSEIISAVQNSDNPYLNKSITYRAKITVPFLFGYPNGIGLGLYGVYDNHRNLNGFDAKKLSLLGYQFFVDAPYGQNNSIISSLIYNNGFVIIEGLKFGINPIIKLVNVPSGNINLKTLPKPYLNKTIIYVDVVDLRTTLSLDFKISVSNNGADFSNEFTITFPPIPTQTPNVTDTPTPTPSDTPSATPSDTPSVTPSATPSATPSPTPTQTPLPTNTPSPCKGNPICGGETQGKCSKSGCVCILPYFGDDCSSKVIIDIKPTVNETQPQVTIPYEQINTKAKVSSLVSVYSLREIDFNGKIKNEYLFGEWDYEVLSDGNEFKYSTEIVNKNDGSSITKIVAVIKKFETSTDIVFANEKITMLPSTMKYNINISNYHFIDKLHSLNLVMYTAISTSQTEDVCSASSFGDSSSQLSSQYIKIQINDVSLYGEFIKRAIVDGQTFGISNKKLDEELSLNTGNNAHTFIAIEIPNYDYSIELDPNFSVLLESNSPTDNSICSSNKSGLSKTQLAGIIIGSVLFAAVIAIGVTFLVFRNSTSLRIKARSFKLKPFKK